MHCLSLLPCKTREVASSLEKVALLLLSTLRFAGFALPISYFGVSVSCWENCGINFLVLLLFFLWVKAKNILNHKKNPGTAQRIREIYKMGPIRETKIKREKQKNLPALKNTLNTSFTTQLSKKINQNQPLIFGLIFIIGRFLFPLNYFSMLFL